MLIYSVYAILNFGPAFIKQKLEIDIQTQSKLTTYLYNQKINKKKTVYKLIGAIISLREWKKYALKFGIGSLKQNIDKPS